MNMPEAIFLDMDGTLVDSENVGVEAIKKASAEVLGTAFQEERFQRFLGRSEATFFGAMADEFGEDKAEAIRKSFHEAYLPLLRELPALPGVLKMVPKLAEIAPIMIVSGSTHSQIKAFIKAQNLAQYVSGVVACEDYDSGKPDPEPFRLAAQMARVSPMDCLVFEDSDVGIESAQGAGMKVIALRVGNPEGRYSLEEADLVIDSFDRLLLPMIGQLFEA